MKDTARAEAIVYGLGEDELQVLEAIAERLRFGLHKYGGLKLDGDKRDWSTEASEEAYDLAVYLSCKFIQDKRSKK